MNNKTTDKDMEKELQEYREYVHYLAENQIDEVFYNSDEDHALIVLTELFEHAKERVRIFAGSLAGSIGDEAKYVSSLTRFIGRGGRVQILLNDFDAERAKGSTLYFYLYNMQKSQKHKGRIEVKQTPRKITMAGSKDGGDVPVHFTLGDDRAYRLEVDIEKRESRCNFNSADGLVGKMAKAFDNMFADEASTDIELATLL